MSDAVQGETVAAVFLFGIVEQSHLIEIGNLQIVVTKSGLSTYVDSPLGGGCILQCVSSLERRATAQSIMIRRQWDIAVGELSTFFILTVDLARSLIMGGGFSDIVVVVPQIPLDMTSQAGPIHLTVVFGTEWKDVYLVTFYEMFCVDADKATE